MTKRNDLTETVGVVGASLIAMILAPFFMDQFGLFQFTVYIVIALFALSQAFVWGIGGIVSFGQAMFFGIGGYAYAILSIHFGDSTYGVIGSLVFPGIFAAVLGYFIFYGRISDIYVGVITMAVSLMFLLFFNASSGDGYAILGVPLGGYNGIPALPPLNIPGNPASTLGYSAMWYVVMSSLLLVYALLRWMLTRRFGKVVVAIRENEERVGMLGYDPRRYKLATFVIGALIAGLAGSFYASWGGFISPTVFSLTMSVQVIVYVLVGGLGTLVGPILAAIALQMLVSYAGTQAAVDPTFLLGTVLLLFVLLIPKGFMPAIMDLYTRAKQGRAQN
ncbi:branched-chain amino acid ABC transporter permease [Chelativorans sp. Marseille-P2723]|uniref:branched-chain amino acid ABC transporter permease n=1 Tax=Chelativorans sp. Marseille-P2723 TaxID=2709133 RepID=UPI0015713447|nr:branched-chain amino acid ABC transporter permease [Chelativorans sp. Marseille-P2723]